MANPFAEETTKPESTTPGGDHAQPPSGGVSSLILNAKLDTLLKVMRVVNIINACGLAVSCYFAFTVVGNSVTLFFLAAYIGIFSLMLLAYELRFKYTEPFVKRMFGFMYSYTGRTLFLIFLGAINFGFIERGDTARTGTKIVIAVGAVTLLNAFFNCFVLCKHPAFRNQAPVGQPKLTDEEMLSYIRAHPELLKGQGGDGAQPNTGAQKKEANPFEEHTSYNPPVDPKPVPSTYNPPSVPLSPKPKPPPTTTHPTHAQHSPSQTTFDDGENPFAQ